MELLRSWGLEERALAAAMDVEWRALATPTLADAASGTPVEVGFPTREQSAVVSPTGPACIPQDELERVMEEHLASLPAARIERGVEVIGVDSRDGGVTVAVRNGSGIRTLRARYLVAADGIRSTVRAALGIATHGPGRVGASLGILFRAPLWEVVGEHRHVIYFVGDDGRKAALPVGLPDRWMVGLGDLEPQDVVREVREVVGVPDLEPEIENVARIEYAVELAERYRERSAFLVGDAAHRLSPRGATGMNTAIRDGYDLGWKLAWVLHGWAGEELLDSYEAERRPVAEHNGLRGADPNGSHPRRRRGAAGRPRRPHPAHVAARRGRARLDARPGRRRAHALHRPRRGGVEDPPRLTPGHRAAARRDHRAGAGHPRERVVAGAPGRRARDGLPRRCRRRRSARSCSPRSGTSRPRGRARPPRCPRRRTP